VSYDVVKPDFYRIHTPDTPWHAGAQGWSQAPWPGWGENPNLIGPRMLAVNGFGSEMSVRQPTTQRMALPGMPMPGTTPPPPVAPTEKKIPWGLIGLAGLVAVGGYFMLKPAGGRVVKSNGKMFRRNADAYRLGGGKYEPPPIVDSTEYWARERAREAQCRLSVRRGVYRGQDGWKVSGRCGGVFGTRIFVRTEPTARAIVRAYKTLPRGEASDEVDRLIREERQAPNRRKRRR
jgi:hypothetical protein